MSVAMPPCQSACPTHTNVAEYIRLILEGDFYGAWKVNRVANVFPSICGRVCVHYCESACKRQYIKPGAGEKFSHEPVAIRGLKRFITDNLPPDYVERFLAETLPIKKNNKAVAVIGSGPAGLAAANDLILSGCEVVVFEALPEPGGMLMVGIPSYRLPSSIIMEEINILKRLGVELKLNIALGRDIQLDGLRKDFDAVFVAAGAHKPKLMKVKGEELEGVFPGIVFLRRLSLGEPVDVRGKSVAVIGGGFTAADAARSAIRMGAKAFILYRRGKEEMPMDELEQVALLKEGIPVYYLVAPIEIIGQDGKKVAKLKCVRMELREEEGAKSQKGGRRAPVPVQDSEFEINADIVIPAVAQEPDLTIFPMNFNFITGRQGYSTSVEGVFAAGDFLAGTTNVIEVIAQAHEASIEILKFLGQEPKLPSLPPKTRRLDNSPWYSEDPEKLRREKVYGGWLGPSVKRFQEVEDGMSRELAVYEATRCLQCDYFVDIDKASCYRCGRCVESCPQKAMELVFQETAAGQQGAWFSNGKWYTEDSGVYTKPELCIQCGTCLRACPNQNISFVRCR